MSIKYPSRQLQDVVLANEGVSDQFMNQHLLVKIRQRGTPHRSVAHLGNRLAKAGPMRFYVKRQVMMPFFPDTQFGLSSVQMPT